ncbi:unnamed protein product [Pleuronectes platessa]|uniref:Uncharacterized protein n=1 Tax=Pleuronectes platessa TaxID=8262 RepID=A0A9N7TX77_PLEPL|nr:unnamed protein product [Pleuronectes platessa]
MTTQSHFQGSPECGRQLRPFIPEKRRLQQVDPSQANLSQPLVTNFFSKERCMTLRSKSLKSLVIRSESVVPLRGTASTAGVDAPEVNCPISRSTTCLHGDSPSDIIGDEGWLVEERNMISNHIPRVMTPWVHTRLALMATITPGRVQTRCLCALCVRSNGPSVDPEPWCQRQ